MRNYPPFISDDDIAAIGRGMCARTLPKAAWTHAAHFAATLWLLSQHGFPQVSMDLPGLIRAYNAATGGSNTDTAGYHETITQASVRAAEAFRLQHVGEPLFRMCNSLMSSRLGDPDWLFEYWSRERLLSVEARKSWVEPDLEPLPF